MIIGLSEHPRASVGIRRARFGGGLAMAVVAGWLAHRAGVPGTDVVLRALLAGIAGHLACWALAIAWYRAVATGEIRQAIAHREARVRELRAHRDEKLRQEG